MIASIINMLTVIIGSAIGLIVKKGISNRISDAVMIGIGICTVYIGFTSVLYDVNVLIIISSMIIGTIIGTAIDLDKKINDFGEIIEAKFGAAEKKGMIAKGFITASLLFCIGSMTITGALQAGISGDTKLIITKSMLDLMSSMMLASSLGFGVMLSSIFVLLFQGSITLLAEFISPFLNTNAINAMTSVGSLITIMLGLNLMSVSKIKVANYLPAIFIAPIIVNIMIYIEQLLKIFFIK